jgi:hypothetical protein
MKTSLKFKWDLTLKMKVWAKLQKVLRETTFKIATQNLLMKRKIWWIFSMKKVVSFYLQTKKHLEGSFVDKTFIFRQEKEVKKQYWGIHIISYKCINSIYSIAQGDHADSTVIFLLFFRLLFMSNGLF